MNCHARLLSLLQKKFPTATIDLKDDSEQHAGHKHGFDGETHYRLRIKAAEFAGLNTVARHRLIFAAIKPETDAGLHSFVIEAADTP